MMLGREINAFIILFQIRSYTIRQVAKMYKSKITYLTPRLGERYASALSKISKNNKLLENMEK